MRRPGVGSAAQAVGGRSASAGGAETIGGAKRIFTGAPQDGTCNGGDSPGRCIGDTPYGRRIGFQRMPADANKYQPCLHDADASYTLFELNGAKCVELLADPLKCAEMVRWLASAGLAFLDGPVRQLPAALQWLQGKRVENARHGVADWLRKRAIAA